MGLGRPSADNPGAGGILAGIDVESGQLLDDAIDGVGRRFSTGSDSGMRIKGLQVPNWQAVFDKPREYAAKYPLKNVEWDIAIRGKRLRLHRSKPRSDDSWDSVLVV